MKIIITDNYMHLSEKAADILADVIKKNPNAVLGLATGTSPIGTYKKLIDMFDKGTLSFANVKSANLDEYVGLKAEHKQSYHYFMNANLFGHVNISGANVHLPEGCGDDMEKNCRDYDELLDILPRDVQLLGIGSNGHIGFNEPGTAFESRTHIVDLTEKTRKDNSRLFDEGEKVPEQAITMGIHDIMAAKKIILLAYGAKKADAIYKTVCGEVTEECPASVLQLHKDVTLIIDAEAASKLDKTVIARYS